MSAYMCSEKQLTVLAAYAVKHCPEAVPYRFRTSLDQDGFERTPGGYKRTISTVFGMLVSENLASLNARYGARDNEATFDEYVPDEKALKLTLPALHIIKLCHHYAYQSCEHDGWKGSDARKLIDAIESHAVHNLPGYVEAPWGI
jgi:hypothetical protein